MMSKEHKATIEAVAKLAGVSIATVSRVINAKDKVKDSTKQKVMDAIHEIGFEIKRNDLLSDQDSKTILVCVTELKNPFNIPVIDGIQNAAQNHSYDILLLQTKHLYTTFEDYESVLKSQRFAGVVFLSSITSAQLQAIGAKLNYRCPMVFCSEYVAEANIPYVCINDEEAMYKATSYILAGGRKKIALINSGFKYNYAKHREIGFRKAMEDNDVPINENAIVHLSSVTYNLAYSNALLLLEQEETPDAILCVSDVFAMGALKACKKKGIRVPEDCAVIGFDNIDLAAMMDPPLTTIDQPSYQLGYQSCELLVEKIKYPETPNKRIVLDTELIVRESTPITIKKGMET